MIYDSFPCQTIFSWIWMFSARLDYQTELDCVALRFSQENRLKNMKISCTSWMQTALTFLVWSKYIPIYSKSKVVLKHPSEVGPVMYQNQMWWLAMLAMSQQRQSTVKVVSVELVHLKNTTNVHFAQTKKISGNLSSACVKVFCQSAHLMIPASFQIELPNTRSPAVRRLCKPMSTVLALIIHFHTT